MVVEGTVSKSMQALSLRTTVHEALRSSHSWKSSEPGPGALHPSCRNLGVTIVPLTGRARCGKTPQVDRRHEHYGGGHVSGLAAYKSLCNRVFGTYTKRFPGPRLDSAIGLEKNFGKFYDRSRLTTVHFPSPLRRLVHYQESRSVSATKRYLGSGKTTNHLSKLVLSVPAVTPA